MHLFLLIFTDTKFELGVIHVYAAPFEDYLFSEKKRQFVLIMPETAMASKVEYDTSSGSVGGYVTLPVRGAVAVLTLIPVSLC